MVLYDDGWQYEGSECIILRAGSCGGMWPSPSVSWRLFVSHVVCIVILDVFFSKTMTSPVLCETSYRSLSRLVAGIR